MKQRSLFLIRFYLLTLIIFLVAKVAFMIANLTDHSFTAIDVANVIWHGLSLDLSTSIYVLLLPFIITMISLWWDGDILRRILRFYYGIIAIMLALAFVADTCLYPFWGFKLDASCLQYLETPVEARASVSGLYMVIALIVLMTLTYGIYRLYRLIPFWESRPSHQQTATLGNILLIPVFIIGIRGGLDESTTNVGQVYFSQNQFLNHAAVNPVFSFLSSFEKTASNIVDYDFFSEEEYKRLLLLRRGVQTADSGSLPYDIRRDRFTAEHDATQYCHRTDGKCRRLSHQGHAEPQAPERRRHRLHELLRQHLAHRSRNGVYLQRLSLIPDLIGDEDAQEVKPAARHRLNTQTTRLQDFLPLRRRHQFHQHA